MRILWQECRYLLRSRFMWIVAVLGFIFCFWIHQAVGTQCINDFMTSHEFAMENGTDFEMEDAEKYVDFYLSKTEGVDEEDVWEFFKEEGLKDISLAEIAQAYELGEPAEIAEKVEKAFENSENVSYLKKYLFELNKMANIVQQNSLETEFSVEEWSKKWETRLSDQKLPQWKQNMLIDAHANLEKRVDEIIENQENHHFLPVYQPSTSNYDWFEYLFNVLGLGALWPVTFVLAGIVSARGLGGSFRTYRSSLVYTGKSGRKLIFYKTLAAMVVSGMMYLILTVGMTLWYVIFFRLDLYWNVPLASLVHWEYGTVIFRFAVTIGGYWWFQLGVGLGVVLIMTLIFSATMIFTKSSYAGSAISIGISLILLGVIQMIPAAQTSFLLMGSPIGLFLQAGKFLQEQFLFSILSHFEGIMLLIWGGIAAVLVALGFIRFRKVAL